MDDEKGNQIVLPASSNVHNGRDFGSVARVYKVELKESREPALRCPSPHVILLSVKTSSDGDIDRLAGIAIGDDKDVNECAEGEKEAQEVDQHPEMVKIDGKIAGIRAGAQKESEGSSQADEDKGGTGGCIARVSLIGHEIFWLALEVDRCSIAGEWKGAAGRTVQEANRGGDKGQLNYR